MINNSGLSVCIFLANKLCQLSSVCLNLSQQQTNWCQRNVFWDCWQTVHQPISGYLSLPSKQTCFIVKKCLPRPADHILRQKHVCYKRKFQFVCLACLQATLVCQCCQRRALSEFIFAFHINVVRTFVRQRSDNRTVQLIDKHWII